MRRDHRFPVRPDTYMQILTHGIKELEASLTPDDPHYVELLSINTALGHLPCYTDTDPDKITERNREKEIIKRRLAALYRTSPEIRGFIDRNVILFSGTPTDARSFDLLDRLLQDQAYRLSYWRVATEEINYRRFFDINELAAIRMEEPAVFGAVDSAYTRQYLTGVVPVQRFEGKFDPTPNTQARLDRARLLVSGGKLTWDQVSDR